MRGAWGKGPTGQPSSSTSGLTGGGGVGGGDWEVGERRCLRIGGGAASSESEEEFERGGCSGDKGGFLECWWQKVKKLACLAETETGRKAAYSRSSRSFFCSTALSS